MNLYMFFVIIGFLIAVVNFIVWLKNKNKIYLFLSIFNFISFVLNLMVVLRRYNP